MLRLSGQPVEETYNILSLWIIRITQIQLALSLTQYIFTIILASFPQIHPDNFWKTMLHGYRTFLFLSRQVMIQIFMWQAIEWQAMLFIIQFEKKMTLFELTFVQENTQVFQKKERKQFVIISLVYTLMTVVIFFGSLSQYVIQSMQDETLFDKFESAYLITQGPIIFLLVVATFILLQLAYLMYNRHNLEFNKARLEFALFFCILAYCSFIEIYDALNSIQKFYFVNDCSAGDKSQARIRECFENANIFWIQGETLQPSLRFRAWIQWILQAPQLSMCFTQILIKSPKDIL